MAEDRLIARRGLLALAGGLLAACASTPEPRPKPQIPPLPSPPLDTLLPRAGLTWAIRVKPRTIAEIPWLIPAIGKIVPEPRFDGFRDKVGLDIRQIPEAILARYGEPLSATAAYVRHNVDAAVLEKKITARLSSDVVKSEDRPDVFRVGGKLGTEPRAFARLGRDVAVYQQGGDTARGPVRIASLYAMKKLKARSAFDGEPLGPLVARFGDAPVIAVALGPFEDEWKRAARGLLEVATALGAAARPTSRQNIGLSFALTGEFNERASEAADTLRDAWNDIARTGTGNVLGLDQPTDPPVAAGAKNVVTLSVELEPGRLAEGLRALVAQDIEAIMRLD
ncbi:MAG: hypothetical protein HOV80_39640 [Polyangiaceae bacterium]|nr:hypothetical protein [Polyangiaceae bacterium]